MLDLAGILFSSVMMFLVILRAVQMDAVTPWFKPPKVGPDSSGLRLSPNSKEPFTPPVPEKKPAAPKGWRK